MNEVSDLLIRMYLRRIYSEDDTYSNIEMAYYCKFDEISSDRVHGVIGISYDRENQWYSTSDIRSIYVRDEYRSLLDDLVNDIKDNFKQIDCKFHTVYGDEFFNNKPATLYFDPELIEFEKELDAAYDHFALYNNDIGSIYLDPNYDLKKLFDIVGEDLTLNRMFLEAFNAEKVSRFLKRKIIKNFGEDWLDAQRLIYEVSGNKISGDI